MDRHPQTQVHLNPQQLILMNVNTIVATTSSRLNREQQLSPEAEAQQQAICTQTLAYCHQALVGVASPWRIVAAFLGYFKPEKFHQR
jgi:hypothetical protein